MKHLLSQKFTILLAKSGTEPKFSTRNIQSGPGKTFSWIEMILYIKIKRACSRIKLSLPRGFLQPCQPLEHYKSHKESEKSHSLSLGMEPITSKWAWWWPEYLRETGYVGVGWMRIGKGLEDCSAFLMLQYSVSWAEECEAMPELSNDKYSHRQSRSPTLKSLCPRRQR